MSDILADYHQWKYAQPNRLGTHNDRCHMYHDDCMIARMADEIGRLRAEVERLRMTDAEREAVSIAAQVIGVASEPHAATLRGLLARRG